MPISGTPAYLVILLELVTVLAVAWRRPVLRRDMGYAALLGLPVVLLQPLASGDLVQALAAHGWLALAARIVTSSTFFSLAAAAYTAFLHPRMTPVVHPRRGLLSWLWLGPVLVLVLFGIFKVSLAASLLLALGLDVVIVLILARVLIWDMLAAAGGMAALYLVAYLILGQYLSSYLAFGTGSFSGITLLGLPVEELVLVAVYGSLWGPLYSALRIPLATQDFSHRHHRPKQLVIGLSVLLGCAGYYALDTAFMRSPRVAAAPTVSSLVSPLTVRFDRPIDQRSLSVKVTPPVEGDISFGDSYWERYFVTSLTFTPHAYFQPDTAYTVEVSGIGNVLGHKTGSYSYTFHTAALPAVTGSLPKTGDTGVAICDPLTVTLDQSPQGLADFAFQLTPAIDLTATVAGSSYTVKPAACLSQSTSYTLTAKRAIALKSADGIALPAGDSSDVYSISFTTKGAPGIAGFQPQGAGVLASTRTFSVSFSEPMAVADPSSYLSISPAVTGAWAWKDPQTLVFTATKDLSLDTSYAVSVHKGLPDQKHGYLPQDATYLFSTPGPVRVASFVPANGSGGVASAAVIKVTFDQPVDHASAQAAFSLAPAVAGTFSWQGQTMLYSVTLQDDSQYVASEAAGVRSTIGLPLAATARTSFATQQSTTLLNIPVYYQRKALSCEVASLMMALNYRGAGTNETTLLAALGADPAPRSGGIWSDPNLIFVGDVNGHQNTTGYGVYPGPIARVANQYRSAQAFQGWSVTQLADALAKGNPVVFWGVAGNAVPDSWNTVAGAHIPAWVGEHVRTVVGFTGPASNPSSFIINDPIFGRLRWTTAQFKANWGTFGNEGVVIY